MHDRKGSIGERYGVRSLPNMFIVDGEGVVGEQPVLEPGQSHDYVSGCPLTTPFGSMEGFYTFQRPDGASCEVRIPFFPLSAPETAEGRSPR